MRSNQTSKAAQIALSKGNKGSPKRARTFPVFPYSVSVSRSLFVDPQVLRRIAEEADPDGTGLTFSDFEGLACRMPDFVNNFRWHA